MAFEGNTSESSDSTYDDLEMTWPLSQFNILGASTLPLCFYFFTVVCLAQGGVLKEIRRGSNVFLGPSNHCVNISPYMVISRDLKCPLRRAATGEKDSLISVTDL